MAWTKVVTESTAGKIAQEAATATSIGNLTGAVTSVNRATTIGTESITEAKLKVTNAPTDNYLLSSDTASGGFTWVSPPSGDVTGVTAGTGLTGGGASGALTLAVDLSELTDMTQTMVSSDEFIVLDDGADRRKAASEIGLSVFNNDSGFTTNVGDITGVTAGTGISGGGASGSVTVALALNELSVETTFTAGSDSIPFHDDGAGADKLAETGTIPVSFFSNDASFISSSRTITAGAGLTGGGDLSANRTLNVVGGTGITANANDIALTAAGAGAATYGSTADGTKIDTITLDAYGRVTAVATGATGSGSGDITGVTITTDSGGGSAASDTGGSADFSILGTSGVGVTNSGATITVTAVPSEIDHDSLSNFAPSEHFTQANITTVGTISNGSWNASAIPVSKGGTGATATTGYGNNVLSAGPTFTGTIGAASLTLSGDLTVSGAVTTINTTNLTIEDNLITLNSNVTGTPTPDVDAGIEVERGTRTNTSIKWDEGEHYWSQRIQLSSANDTVGIDAMIPAVESASAGTSGSTTAVGNFFVNTATNSLYVNV